MLAVSFMIVKFEHIYLITPDIEVFGILRLGPETRTHGFPLGFFVVNKLNILQHIFIESAYYSSNFT